MHLNYGKMIEYYAAIFPFLTVTFCYVTASLILGILFGGILAAMRLGKNRIFRWISTGYVNTVRCIPSVVLIFLIFYGLPLFLDSFFGFRPKDISRIVYVIVTFSLFEAANCCETFRSAVSSVDNGQYEAALMSGLTGTQAYARIILPQALKVAIPNMGNSDMFLIKEGALAYTIGLQDVFGRGSHLSSLSYNTYNVEIYIAMFFIYWPIIMILEFIFRKIELKLSYDKQALELKESQRGEKTVIISV